MPSTLLRPARALSSSAVAAFALCILFGLLSLLAAMADPSRAADRLRPAIADQRLYETMPLPLGSREVSAWEGNDCLVFTMLVLPRQSLWRDATSPRIPTRLTPLEAGEPVQARCARLAELITTDAADAPTRHYDRYLHGQRVVGALVLPWAGPELLRLGTTLALILTLGGLVIFAGLRGWRRPASPLRNRDLTFAWFAACLLLFHGTPIFSRYWTHALSDLVPALLLWGLYLAPRHGTAGRAAMLGAFGCLVSLFEFLTGQLPLSGALILLVAAAEPTLPAPRVVLTDLLCFGIGVTLPFALKFALGSWAFEDFAVGEAGGQLLHRMHGPVAAEMSPREVEKLAAWGFDIGLLDTQPWWRIPYTIARVFYFAFILGAGSLGLGLALLLGSFATVAWSIRTALRSDRLSMGRVWLALGAAAVVIAWYLVFLNHTLLHTAWMVRCMIVFPLAAGTLVLCRLPRRRARA